MTKKICTYCYKIKTSNKSDKETCGFCDSELCMMNFLEPLDDFLKTVDIEDIHNKHKRQIKRIKETGFWDRRKRFYLKDYLSDLNDVIKLYEEMLKNN